MGEVEVHALRQVNLLLDEGRFVVLLGPSGSGKSTLLNIIGGLDMPTSGQVLYRDTDLTSADEAALTAYRRRHVGFVFQFYNLIPEPDRRGERRARHRDLGCADDAGGGARARQARSAARSFPGAAVRRRAAARGHRARHRQASVGAALRRADRCARHLHRASSCSRRSRASTPSSARPRSSSRTTRRSPSMADRVIRLADGRVTAIEDRTEKLVAARAVVVAA